MKVPKRSQAVGKIETNIYVRLELSALGHQNLEKKQYPSLKCFKTHSYS